MQEWESGVCNENSGFLFRHPCDRPANQVCSLCQRPVCSDHAHVGDANQLFCTSCTKKSRRITRGHQRQRGYRDDDFYDDPYFYGPRYGGYWYRRGVDPSFHDQNDFTEADGASFNQFGDDEFESDMTES